MSMKNIVAIAPPRSVFKRSRPDIESDVVIVILGFAGALEKHLVKYEKLYHSKGYDTLTFTSPLEEDQSSLLLKNRRDISGIVDDLRKILSEKDVALHVFSMNGIFTLCSIELKHPDFCLISRAKGIIFDSCPVELGFASLALFYDVWDVAYRDLLKNANFITRTKYRLQGVYEISRLANLYSYLAIRRAFGLDIRQWSAFDFLLDHPNLPRVLSFVYSDGDTICDAQYAIKFANIHQKRGGRLVDTLHLKESQHVQHLRSYPKEYSALVTRFLDNIKLKAKL